MPPVDSQETVVDTSTPPPETAAPDTAAAPPANEPAPEQTVEQKIDALKTKSDAQAKAPGGLAPATAFTANTKYKVMDKEHEIPKEFQSLMKDADSEKKVREIFERSTGLDVVKENLSAARTERDQAKKEHAELSGSLNDLRSTYQSAIKSGDMHKLDQFWKKLDIPQDVLMQYALAKVQLQEMPEAQRNALMEKQRAEIQADDLRRQQAGSFNANLQQQIQLKSLMLESSLRKPEHQNAQADFETRIGKPGSFEAEVRRFGEYEWHRSGGKVDLSPEQAIAAVIKNYGLSTEAKATTATPAANAQQTDPSKKVVVPINKTIPNLGSGGSQSPLKSKPRSIEDLKALGKRAAEGEAI
jgi:hypothetical protein